MRRATADPPSRLPRSRAKQAPGFYRFLLGDYEVTILSDGYFELPGDSFATNADAAARTAFFADRFLPLSKVRLQASPLLIDTGDTLVLVDSGMGAQAWAPDAGRLAATLQAAGVSPEAVDIVVLTHAHKDHLGGLVPVDSGVAGAPRFPNAEIVLSDVEVDLWTGGDLSRLPEWAARQGLAWHEAIFGALGDRVRPIKAGSEVGSGIRSVGTAGHTQGHLSFLVESDGESMLVTGDAIASIHLAFEHPEWQAIWDHDRERAAQTRARLLDHLTTDRLLVVGYHFPFPGVGHVVKSGDGYRWLPVDWAW